MHPTWLRWAHRSQSPNKGGGGIITIPALPYLPPFFTSLPPSLKVLCHPWAFMMITPPFSDLYAQTLVTSLVMGIPISCSLTQPDSYYAMPKSMVAVRKHASEAGRGFTRAHEAGGAGGGTRGGGGRASAPTGTFKLWSLSVGQRGRGQHNRNTGLLFM